MKITLLEKLHEWESEYIFVYVNRRGNKTIAVKNYERIHCNSGLDDRKT